MYFMSCLPSIGKATYAMACSLLRLSLDALLCNLGQGSLASTRRSRTCCAYPGSKQNYPASDGCRHVHREAYGMWMLGFLAGRLCGLAHGSGVGGSLVPLRWLVTGVLYYISPALLCCICVSCRDAFLCLPMLRKLCVLYFRSY